MNCFALRSQLTELARNQPHAETAKHIQECTTCAKKLAHLKELRQLIKRLPTHSLVPELKNDEGIDYDRDDSQDEQRKNRFFDQSPWYVKSGIEAFTLALMTVGIIWGIPKVRQLYDHSMQRRLETIDLNDINNANLESDANSGSTTQAMAPEVKATENEVWRINIKTDAIHDIQKRLLAAVKAEHSVDDRESIAGVVAPGGVQIEFLASTEFIQQIKDEVNSISKKLEQENAQPVAAAVANAKIKTRTSGLTWYKSKSKVKLPKGKIKIVIWLSQM